MTIFDGFAFAVGRILGELAIFVVIAAGWVGILFALVRYQDWRCRRKK